jgi:hypothetical protein
MLDRNSVWNSLSFFFGHTRHYTHHLRMFYCGLLMLRLARRTGKSKYKRRARPFIAALAKLVSYGAVNCHPMLRMLQAEQLSLRGRPSLVKQKYDKAIALFARSGFVHLQAIANERIGDYMFEYGDVFWARTYLSQAVRLYSEWGAKIKAEKVHQLYSELELSSSLQASSKDIFSVRGRTRFKPVPAQVRADSTYNPADVIGRGQSWKQAKHPAENKTDMSSTSSRKLLE